MPIVGKLRNQPVGNNIFSWRHTCNYLRINTQIKLLPASLMYSHLHTSREALQSLSDSLERLHAINYRALTEVNSNKCNPRSAS